MADIIGQTVTTGAVNLRQGTASTSASIAGELAAGTAVSVVALATGDTVAGNARWYLTDAGDYVWSGDCGPLVEAAVSVPNVVDLSHGSNVTSFAQAKAGGVLGIIHKATTGGTGQDPAYASRRSAAISAGLLWGAYHWGTAAPIDQQIANFLNTAAPDSNTLLALDFEADAGNQMTLDGARQFLQGILSGLGRRAVLYSGILVKTSLGNTVDPFFGAHRLWLSQYGSQPKVQASWNSYWLWQYTDGTAGPGPYTAPGIPGDAAGHLDCNHFMGSAAQLAQQWAS
jgi:GH25 family lysozyme M1 (1,4-beta-N-acetylmuramidase)